MSGWFSRHDPGPQRSSGTNSAGISASNIDPPQPGTSRVHDPVASISQPVRRLRGFERVTLGPDERRTVTFRLDRRDWGFYDNRGKFIGEPGRIDVYAGNSSSAELATSFTVGG